ncbi:MAG TPA: thiol:disulfide interchange protein DsbA/DsbL [Methylococcaceae bacterium]|nr:thiol:disulfide interchange protein DsbA/DsbL [Methylococcaceae bacterium]
MKTIRWLLGALLFWSLTAMAETAGPEFETLNPPQPTGDAAKIEVMEFFWYGCPHCLHFEPHINGWLKTKPEDVVFIRQPAVFNARWGAHAKAYFTAEALGVVDKVHADFYDAIQNKKQALESEDDLAKFFAAHGVADEMFRKAYHSFGVDRKMRQAEGVSARYGVTSTPTLIVNGKYRIKGASAQNIATLNRLIEQERANRPAAK